MKTDPIRDVETKSVVADPAGGAVSSHVSSLTTGPVTPIVVGAGLIDRKQSDVAVAKMEERGAKNPANQPADPSLTFGEVLPDALQLIENGEVDDSDESSEEKARTCLTVELAGVSMEQIKKAFEHPDSTSEWAQKQLNTQPSTPGSIPWDEQRAFEVFNLIFYQIGIGIASKNPQPWARLLIDHPDEMMKRLNAFVRACVARRKHTPARERTLRKLVPLEENDYVKGAAASSAGRGVRLTDEVRDMKRKVLAESLKEPNLKSGAAEKAWGRAIEAARRKFSTKLESGSRPKTPNLGRVF